MSSRYLIAVHPALDPMTGFAPVAVQEINIRVSAGRLTNNREEWEPVPLFSTQSVKSSAVVSLTIFLVLNGCLGLGAALNAARTKNPDQNGVLQTIDSAVQQYKKAEHPDVVLLGSSLVMSPVWTADFRRFGNVADFYRHHRSYLLEKKLSENVSGLKEVFNFAVPGAMVSDMDLILDKLLTGPKKPSLIVYGLAPRDFMDDLAGSETKTVVFDRLGDVSDLNKSNFADTSTDEKLELVFNKVVYLFGKRTRYQAKADSFLRKLAHQATAKGRQDYFLAAANAANACPLFQDRRILWQKSLDEYRMRYQRFNQLQFKKQQHFLQDLLSTCAKNQIPVVLVNMPLTQANLSLMPEGLYSQYLEMLHGYAERNDVALVDLGKEHYGDQCFYDTVHLNEVGAEPFLTAVAQAIESTRDKLSKNALAAKQKVIY